MRQPPSPSQQPPARQLLQAISKPSQPLQGFSYAQSNLGISYANGHGVPQDDVAAVGWYRLSADQGNAQAQYALGLLHGIARGVPKDHVLAYMWLKLAAAQGHEDAIKNRDIVAKEMTPAQIAKAQAMAQDWQPKQ